MPASAYASTVKFQKPSANMSGVTLINCSSDKCIKIESANASEGFIVRGLSFGAAKLTLTNSRAGVLRAFAAKNVFFDYATNRLYVEGLDNNPEREAIYELSTAQLKLF